MLFIFLIRICSAYLSSSWRLNHSRRDLVFCILRIFQMDLWNPLAFLWAGHIIIIPVLCICLLIYWKMRSYSVIRCHFTKDTSVESSPHLSLKTRYKSSRTWAQIWAAWANIKFCDWINLCGCLEWNQAGIFQLSSLKPSMYCDNEMILTCLPTF